jgi:hypothetical protein
MNLNLSAARLCALALLLSATLVLPADARSPLPGATVEIEQYYYTFYLGGSGWSLECRYRVDEGEWLTAAAEGSGEERILRLPGTSVQATAEGFDVRWSCGDEVVSLRIGEERVF